MNRVERRVRDLINPYSTAFASWWCHSARYWRLPHMITGNKTAARPDLPRPAVPRGRRSIRVFGFSVPSVFPAGAQPWRVGAVSRFGEADRMRCDRRERPRHGGREQDNGSPGRRHSAAPVRRQVSLTDQWCPASTGPARVGRGPPRPEADASAGPAAPEARVLKT
jgi:hypothetical protein